MGAKIAQPAINVSNKIGINVAGFKKFAFNIFLYFAEFNLSSIRD